MNQRLRLMVTTSCQRNCAKCCNKRLSNVEKFDFATIDQYDTVILTGGEPMLEYKLTSVLIAFFNRLGIAVYIYSSKCEFGDIDLWVDLINNFSLAGITFTVHEEEHIPEFIRLDELINSGICSERKKGVSLWLNKFDHFDMGYTPFNDWIIRPHRWLDDCPVPEGEDLRIL